MFTGIVRAYQAILAIERHTALTRLQIDLSGLTEGLEQGASVAINGTCLTVTGQDGDGVWFDVIQQTLDNTNLGTLAVGQCVNIERSFRVGDEVGGHILSGHIAAAVPVVAVEQSDNLRRLWFSAPPEWLRYVLLRGYVALDGASLTVSHLDTDQGRFAVSLIPETIERTTLGSVAEGERVNLEVDSQSQSVIATVERLLEDPDWRDRLRTALKD